MNNKPCPICLIDEIKEPLQCKGCCNFFCKKCVLLWKINNDNCPLKCSNPWNIEIDIKTDDYDGFILCPKCNRLGSLLCPRSGCRRKIDFREENYADIIICEFCEKKLKFFKAVPHEKCDSWSSAFYFYCEECDKKFCDCIIKV